MPPKVDHAARSHSSLPPSSANKWLNCWGWMRTVAEHMDRYGYPEAGPAAAEGTKAHEKFERHLLGLPALGTPTGLNEKEYQVQAEETRRPLDPNDDEYDDLMQCVEWIEDQPGSLYPETRMDFGEGMGYVGLTGTVDVTLVEEDRLTIADLKYGRNVVEVQDKAGRLNPQLMTYLVGAINRFGPRPRYRLAVLQPRAWHKDGPIRVVDVTAAQLAVFMFELEEAIEANYKGGDCNVGPWCRNFCPALASCRAVVLEGRRRLAETPWDV